MDVTSYLLGKKAGGGTPINNQNKNVTITENGTTTVSADVGYTGLGTVGITTNVPTGIGEYFTTEVTEQNKSDFKSVYIKKYPPITIDSNVQSTYELFGSWPYNTLDLSQFNSSNIRDFSSMFYACTTFSQIDVSNFNTSNATNMYNMFSLCSNLTNLNLSNFNTGNVTNMNSMFANCYNLTNLNVSSFNTSNVINMNSMFASCWTFSQLDLSSFDTSNVADIRGMFTGCSQLETITGSFDLTSGSDIVEMFAGCSSLKNLPTFSNIGKGFSEYLSAHEYQYTFDVSSCEQLTHTSLMNIINGLYDIATAGIQTQDLILGATNLAKLSSAEIALATAKGWTVS